MDATILWVTVASKREMATYRIIKILTISWVFRAFGESACLIRSTLTYDAILLMKNHVCCYFMRSLVLIGVSLLLSLPEGLRVERIEPQGALLALAVVSVRPSSCCPFCSQASSQVHSRYQRTLRDVPCGGRQVVLHLSVRKFFCRNPACARRIFTERLPTFVEPWARVTIRLFEGVQAIGLATSGELGTRLADRIGFHASPTTILRRIMALPFVPVEAISSLGIDDWSFRRGRKFGTILVDLTSHKILDLLDVKRDYLMVY